MECTSRHAWAAGRKQLWETAFSPSVVGCRDLTQFLRLLGCVACFPDTVRNTMTKASWRGKDVFHPTLSFPLWGKPKPELKAERDAETMVLRYLLQGAHAATPWAHPPQDGITYSGPDPLTSTSSQLAINKMFLQTGSQVRRLWPILQLRSLLFLGDSKFV